VRYSSAFTLMAELRRMGATNALGGSAVPLAYLMAGQGGGGTSSSIGNWTPGTPNPAVPF